MNSMLVYTLIYIKKILKSIDDYLQTHTANTLAEASLNAYPEAALDKTPRKKRNLLEK